jgi:hypothetical protein
MKDFWAKALAGPFLAFYIGGGLLFFYGLFDLAGKKLFFLFVTGMVFPPYALIQGLGALLGWW